MHVKYIHILKTLLYEPKHVELNSKEFLFVFHFCTQVVMLMSSTKAVIRFLISMYSFLVELSWLMPYLLTFNVGKMGMSVQDVWPPWHCSHTQPHYKYSTIDSFYKSKFCQPQISFTLISFSCFL